MKFCKIVETETTQILLKKEWDSEEEIYSVSIETEYEDARVIISPKLVKGKTEEDCQRLFEKMIARAEEMGDMLIPAFLNIK